MTTTIDLGTRLITDGWGYSCPSDSVTNGGFFQRPLDVWDPELTPWSSWHRENTAISIKRPNAAVCGARGDNLGDFVAVGAYNGSTFGQNFVVGSIKGTRIHDDFIENDNMYSGVYFNCLGDGTMCGFSCRATNLTDPGRTGENDTLHIEKCLVRLQGFYNSYNVPKYGHYRSGSLFKWCQWAPPVDLVDNVLCAYQKGFDGASLDPPSTLRSAKGTTLIWTGPGTWPADALAKWRTVDPGLVYVDGEAAEPTWAAYASEWKR